MVLKYLILISGIISNSAASFLLKLGVSSISINNNSFSSILLSYINNLYLKRLYKYFSRNIQIAGKITKPKGTKKYGGNSNDVKKPKNEAKIILNYFFLFQLFQFFYY